MVGEAIEAEECQRTADVTPRRPYRSTRGSSTVSRGVLKFGGALGWEPTRIEVVDAPTWRTEFRRRQGGQGLHAL